MTKTKQNNNDDNNNNNNNTTTITIMIKIKQTKQGNVNNRHFAFMLLFGGDGNKTIENGNTNKMHLNSFCYLVAIILSLCIS